MSPPPAAHSTEGTVLYVAHYVGDHRINYTAVPATKPGPGEALVNVHYTGICGTDLHVLHGSMDARVTTPAIIGHEMSGVIGAVGEGVDGWPIGTPVGVLPLAWCGNCPACRAGFQHICHNLNFIGIDSTGSMQNEWIVPAANLIRLPEGVDMRTAALLEPLAVATHDLRRGRVAAGDRVLVIGGGPIGALIAHGARRLGADVLVSEPDVSRRRILEQLGVDAIDPLDASLSERVLAWTESSGADIVFEVSGSQAGMDSAVENLATRGRLVLVAIHPQPRPVNLHRLFWRELEIVGARVYERDDFEAAAALLPDVADELTALVTDVFPLSDAAAAFTRLESGGGVMKVLIDCQGDPQ